MKAMPITTPGFWKKDPSVAKNSPTRLWWVSTGPSLGGGGGLMQWQEEKRQEQPRHKEQRDGPGDGDVAGTGEESDSGVALELGIKLDDRHGRLVPVGGGEDEALAFLEAETLVALAQTDVLDPAQLPAKIDRDLPASGRLLR